MAAWIGSITLAIAAILYILLAFGMPLGEFAMGGKYIVMPRKTRIVCAISVLVQLVAICAILQTVGIVNTFCPMVL